MSAVPVDPPYAIRTDRLLIRCWDPADAPLLDEAIRASLEHLRPWMPWAHAEPTPIDEKVERLRRFRGQFDLGQNFIYGLFEPDGSRVLGGSGLHPSDGAGSVEIGYWIRSDAVGRGLAGESTAVLTRIAIEHCGVERVEINVDPDNAASLSIPRRLGYTEEATLRRRLPTSDPLAPRRDDVRDDVVETSNGEREMTFVRVEMGDRPGNVPRKPLTVREGHHPVLATLPDRDGAFDRAEVEPPVATEGEVVVDPAARIDVNRPAKARGHARGVGAGERGSIDLRDQPPESLSDTLRSDGRHGASPRLEVGGESSLAGESGAELLVVLGCHAGKPVEALRAPRRDTRDRRDRADEPRQQRSAGEGMRPAAGVADHVEPVETERVGEGANVLSDVRDAPPPLPRRLAIPGSREGDVANAGRCGGGLLVLEREPA
jgi:RimJ/RimL family protein N-acetyltransferase